MYNYLVDHALKNVWCTPNQDNQCIFNIFRLSPKSGIRNRIKIMDDWVRPPELNKTFHIFQIGQLNPKLVGLINKGYPWEITDWKSMSSVINETPVFISIYNDTGIELPRFKTYYKFTSNKNFLIAIEEDNNFRNKLTYGEEALFIRFYTNAFFQTYTADEGNNYLKHEGMTVQSNSDILQLQNLYNEAKLLPGYVFAYKNGYLINNIDLVNIQVNDTVEFIYDSSVKKVVSFNIGDLETFNSVKDSKYKYLLRYSDNLAQTIDYHDDIDIHIVAELSSNNHRGYYYHKNSVDSHRMVTHRDYSLSVDYVLNTATKLKDDLDDVSLNVNNFKIKLKIRHSGYNRPLVFDNNRIFELYKLNEELRTPAMVGLNASVDVWKAENLENSGYCELMSANYSQVDSELMERAFGYNAISKLLGDTPVRTYLDNGLQVADLPYGHHHNSTIYEYDVNGILLGKYIHAVGTNYECVNSNTRIVESISGIGTISPNVKFGNNNIILSNIYNYRVYSCPIVSGVPTNTDWEDITGSDLYTVVDNTLVWNSGNPQRYLMVRFDDKFLSFDLSLNCIAGTLYFTLFEMENRGSGFAEYTLPVPLGQLDIFLNGHGLIRGLDYILDFPKIYIINKKYLNQPSGSSIQNIHVRFTGFCNSDLTLDKIEDYGFIEHGLLSNNNRFDIRDDKVLRIIVDGKLKHRDSVIFSEQHQGISVVNSLNGLPYQIKDIVVPTGQLTHTDTYALRDMSIEIDDLISDYLSVFLPQPERNAVSSISERYPIISPFISHLINDLQSGQFNSENLSQNMTDNQVLSLCEEYEFLLDFDPIRLDPKLNSNFVIIHPHNLNNTINLTKVQYQFLTKVVRLYCDGQLDISPFVTFTDDGE